MTPLSSVVKVLLRRVPILFLLLLINPVTAQTVIFDNFNRPDGQVNNGWSNWWDGAYDHPNVNLLNGELITRGYPNQAGGIFRTLPLTFPLIFSFDFRTPLTPANNQFSSTSSSELPTGKRSGALTRSGSSDAAKEFFFNISG